MIQSIHATIFHLNRALAGHIGTLDAVIIQCLF